MRKKRIFVLIIVFIGIALVCFSVDLSRFRNSKNTLFTPIVIQYKDGGTEVRLGLGYSVVSWHRLAIRMENGEEVRGVETGKELLLFPKCYTALLANKMKPSKELLFSIEE